MHRSIHVLTGLLIALAIVHPACAAVNDGAANGFSVSENTHIAAPPGKVYEELVGPAHWWSSRHTFSQDAGNLVLDPKAGGCWCEKLPDGGSVLHLIVVRADPGKILAMRGALGPLQGSGVEGAMTISLKPAADGTDLTLTYTVGGYLKDGLQRFAGPVDSVLAEQVARLKALIETGSPEPKS